MKLNHIMMIEFVEENGSFQIEKVALFNSEKIGEEEAMQIINTDSFDKNVLCIPKTQWESLFLNKGD